MFNLNISKKLNKKFVVAIAILLLLALSQWLMVSMVYAHKMPYGASLTMARLYNLKAATIENEDEKIVVSLEDFLKNKHFVQKFVASQNSSEDLLSAVEDLDNLVWDKVLKYAWIYNVAMQNNITVEQEDIDYYMTFVGGQDMLEDAVVEKYQVSFDEYTKLVVEPSILEAKVHDYLLSSYNDLEGVNKIQEAYALLESENGNNWEEVVAVYSEDPSYSNNSFFLAEEELVGFYEPIKELEVGQYSKIVQTPLGYIIWYLYGISEDNGKKMMEVGGVFVAAKGMDSFFDQYLATAKVNKIY